MVLYDVKVRGLRSALNLREISHLYRAGHLQPYTACKRKGEAAWSTIGEMFPLLQSTAKIYILPDHISPGVRQFRRGVRMVMLILLLIAGTFIFRGRLNKDSAAANPATLNLQRVTDTIELSKHSSSE